MLTQRSVQFDVSSSSEVIFTYVTVGECQLLSSRLPIHQTLSERPVSARSCSRHGNGPAASPRGGCGSCTPRHWSGGVLVLFVLVILFIGSAVRCYWLQSTPRDLFRPVPRPYHPLVCARLPRLCARLGVRRYGSRGASGEGASQSLRIDAAYR